MYFDYKMYFIKSSKSFIFTVALKFLSRIVKKIAVVKTFTSLKNYCHVHVALITVHTAIFLNWNIEKK